MALCSLLSVAHAVGWGELATISETLGVSGGRLCIGEASRGDIGCPTYAPSLTTAGDISVTGNLSAAAFIGDGSGLTGITTGAVDRITSGTTNITAASNQSLTFTTAGTQRMVIGETGNVGIGTTAPSSTLHVLKNTNYSTQGQIVASGSSDPTKQLWLGLDSTNNFGYLQAIKTGTGYYPLILNAYGSNVGIGTTAPQATLQVSGSFTVSTSTQTTTPSLFVGTNGNVGVGTAAPTQALTINGSINFIGVSSASRGLIGPPSWDTSFISLQNATMAESAANSAINQDSVGNTTVNAASGKNLFLRIANGGIATVNANGMTINNANTGAAAGVGLAVASGNVGIGTTAPSKQLHVSGTALITSNTEVSGTIKLAGTGDEACNAATYNTFRVNPATNKLQFCRP